MTSTAPAPVTSEAERIIGAARTRVDAVLDEFLSTKAAQAPDECLPPVVAAVREYVGGGKRLRPVFSHCGWLAAGGEPDAPPVARIGAALELFHSFALIHDDIMDGSELRRGGPAMHVRLAALCQDGADPAAAGRFAVNAAILVGDLCLVWSDELLHAAGLAPARLAAARPLLDAMRTEVMAGQYLDLERPGERDWLSRAWRTIGLKTAGYTVERPLQLGAALAGGERALLRTCTAYGRPLGEAFQLRDDLLGVLGDPARTGKPALDDLREGKATVLMALTWQRASAAERGTLRALHGDPGLDESGAEVLRGIVRSTGADTAVERLVSTRIGQALAALAAAPIAGPVRRALTELAEQVGARDH
ncbi:polyprenyl synthetase family protein [Actinophytocola glycyrrhizae]|uniref:Polyprenyl synthetase family protein n=1 Tax=Actinophytocola glycyrrhizae TaxID=2044873 RepID=A0ABV9RV17_9PSEU